MSSRIAGTIHVDIVPCTADGKEHDKSLIKIKDPKVDLLNKTISFLIKIKEIKDLSSNYEVRGLRIIKSRS